jgi:hypothetical protein
MLVMSADLLLVLDLSFDIVDGVDFIIQIDVSQIKDLVVVFNLIPTKFTVILSKGCILVVLVLGDKVIPGNGMRLTTILSRL